MAKKRNSGPGEINAGSMADIAFLLLIFFLVTTTMDTDAGILRQLPPMMPDVLTFEVPKKNVYEVKVNRNDLLLVEGEEMDISDLKESTMIFMQNPDNIETLPELVLRTEDDVNTELARLKMILLTYPDRKDIQKEVRKWENRKVTIELLGDYWELPKSAVISLQNDPETSYDMYIKVQNELTRAIRELRDELSNEKFGKDYKDLDKISERDKIIAIRTVYPQRISEAEPIVSSNR